MDLHCLFTYPLTEPGRLRHIYLHTSHSIMPVGQQDNVTLNQGTIRASSGSSGTSGSAAGGSSATTLPSTPHSDTPRPDLGHRLSDGRSTTRPRATPPGQDTRPASSAAENPVDSKPPHWTKFTKRPSREYQLSSSQSGRAWPTLSSNAGIRGEQLITQNGSAVVTTSSSLRLPSLPVTNEPILTREEAPEDSLEGESDSKSEAGEEYKEPLPGSSRRYW